MSIISKFVPMDFVGALPTFLFGMVGVFFVLACIMGVIYLLKAFANKKK